MSLELYLAFVVASVVLMLIPGPNVALIAATSIAHGVRSGLTTVAGTSAAMVLQLALVGLGLNALLLGLSDWFYALRWAGVAYLVYLGIRLWRTRSPGAPGETIATQNYKAAFLRGLLVSLTNPKTLLFYGAFFPQFIVPTSDAGTQILVLSMIFLAIAVLIDSLWALVAAKLGIVRFGKSRIGSRIAGSLLIGAGIGLALARKS